MLFSFVLMCRKLGGLIHSGVGSRHWKESLKKMFLHSLLQRTKTRHCQLSRGGCFGNCRNQAHFKEVVCPLNQILSLSKERMAEFQRTLPANPKLGHRKHTRWKPLNLDEFKVNYDNAIFSKQGRAGLGVVIRNSEGAVEASLSQLIPIPTTVAQVEALAVRRAIELALELGITTAV